MPRNYLRVKSRCKEQSKGPVTFLAPESPAFRDDARDLLQLPFECCRSSARNNRFTCNQSPDSFGRRCAKRSQYRRANVRDDRRTAFLCSSPQVSNLICFLPSTYHSASMMGLQNTADWARLRPLSPSCSASQRSSLRHSGPSVYVDDHMRSTP